MDRIRLDILDEILPVPSYNNNARSIVQFKEKYGNLLPNFRKKIELKINELSLIDRPKESEFLLMKFKQSVKEETDELVAKMKEKNWGGIVFGTICALGASAIPGVRALIDYDLASGLETIPGLMGAVYAAYHGYNGKQKSIISSPVAYAAYVRREFY